MATHPNTGIDNTLKKWVGASGFTVAGSTATLTASLPDSWSLRELENAASQNDHAVTIVGGALTIRPK